MHPGLVTLATILLHVTIVVAASIRIIMRKPAVGVALAWLFLIALVPFAGAGFYLLIGERRIGQRRARRVDVLRKGYDQLSQEIIRQGLTNVDWSKHRAEAAGWTGWGRRSSAFRPSPEVRAAPSPTRRRP